MGHLPLVAIRAAVFAALTGTTLANADTLALHEGMEDPSNEGWTQTDACEGCDAVPGSETTASGPHDYWRVEDSSTSGANNYRLDPCAGELAVDWTFEAVLRVVDSPLIAGTDRVGGTGVIVADGTDYWSFYISNEGAGPVGASVGIPLNLVAERLFDPRDDYHRYVINFFANGPGRDDDSADFLIDDELVIAGVGRDDAYDSTAPPLAFFGGVGSVSTSDAHYELVRLDTTDDFDDDGVPNATDNCILEPNPMQTDSNDDGYGNACDPDLDNDGFVNFTDLGIMKGVFFQADADADLTGDGTVNFLDLAVMKALIFQSPGPSCLGG